MSHGHEHTRRPLTGDYLAAYIDESLSYLRKAIALHAELEQSTTFHELGAYRQRALLLTDTLGLVQGMSQGQITMGQPRIRENIHEFAKLLTICDMKSGHATKLYDELSTFFAMVTSVGLTAENQQLGNSRNVRSGR